MAIRGARLQQSGTRLLDTRTSETDWAFLPGASPLQVLSARPPQDKEALATAQVLAAKVDRELEGTFDLTITSPTPGTVVTPGSTISVAVTVDPGVTVDQIVVAGRNQAVNDTSSPFLVSFEIPLAAFRGYEIQAFGRNDTTNSCCIRTGRTHCTTRSSPSIPWDFSRPGIHRRARRDAFAVGERPVRGQRSSSDSRVGGYLDVAQSRNRLGSDRWHCDWPGRRDGDVRANSQGRGGSYRGLPPRPPLIFVDNFESSDTSEWSSTTP